MNTIKTKIYHFTNPITEKEVVWLRGAVGVTNRNEYIYPVVQYKRIKGKAAIVCVGEGGQQKCILEFVEKCPQDIRLGTRIVRLELESVVEQETDVQVYDKEVDYHVRRWLPLNQENLLRYNFKASDTEKLIFLEECILKGNLHTLAKHFGLSREESERISCKILKTNNPKLTEFKKQNFLCFDCVFQTNLAIPEFIGLGQKPSYGYGMVTKDDGSMINAYKPKMIFLLGGRDLEMLTIKKIVKAQQGCGVLDRNLRWDNAVLSAYKDAFDSFTDVDIYAVELREDIPIEEKWRSRYHLIDHHNEYANLPSSLEQVAAILGIELDRRQKLIAANDRGYISAMKALMATDEEIADIRRQDRASQGVTDKDEQLAEQSIAENLTKSEGLIVVKSLTPKFSTICDRLYPYKNLLIYTDSEWVFYGEGKSDLVQCYADAIQQGKIYHGGGEKGYIGSDDVSYTQEEVEQFVESIRNRYEHL